MAATAHSAKWCNNKSLGYVLGDYYVILLLSALINTSLYSELDHYTLDSDIDTGC